MTGAEFSGVDIDLLADYVGGALDGTPHEAVVAALIEEDPAWRDAHARLSGGVAAVSIQLQALGSAPEPMPADVIARLDAALLDAALLEASTTEPSRAQRASEVAGVGSRSADGLPGEHTVSAIGDRRGRTAAGVTGGPADAEPGGDGAAPARHLVAVPSESGRKRMRRLRWAAPVGVAAGVIAFVGFGIQQLNGSATDSATSSAGAGADQSAPLSASGQELGGSAQLMTSGTNYHADTLEQVGSRAMAAPALPQDQTDGSRKSPTPTAGVMTETSGPLSRLGVHEALVACLDAIAVENGTGSITAQTIDFARFNGTPAVIVQFTSGPGTWVWAVGTECGARGVGADKLRSVKVG